MRNTDASADTYTHSHRHTHTNQYAYAPADRYPHTHDDAARDDSHAHWHRTDEPHVHLGDALRLPEYWRRRIRWWFVQRLDYGSSGGRRSAMSRWWHRLAVSFGQRIRRPRRGNCRVRSADSVVQEVACRTCRSMGMAGMALMFGIPAPCPECRERYSGDGR